LGRDPGVRSECAKLEEAELSGTKRVDPNLATAVVTVVAASGSEREFDAFLERYRHPETPQEEARYRLALTAFTDPALAQRIFELVMTEFRSQDVPFVVQSMLASRENGEDAWRWLVSNWDDLSERLPAQSIPRMLEGVRLLCRNQSLADEVDAFLANHPVRTGQRMVDQTRERLRVNFSLAARLSEVAGGVLAAATARLEGR
ncbi:MAG: ERAP1-like C-terminal domain-containing protein, partial [Acidimicrobiales bacterium]